MVCYSYASFCAASRVQLIDTASPRCSPPLRGVRALMCEASPEERSLGLPKPLPRKTLVAGHRQIHDALGAAWWLHHYDEHGQASVYLRGGHRRRCHCGHVAFLACQVPRSFQRRAALPALHAHERYRCVRASATHACKRMRVRIHMRMGITVDSALCDIACAVFTACVRLPCICLRQ